MASFSHLLSALLQGETLTIMMTHGQAQREPGPKAVNISGWVVESPDDRHAGSYARMGIYLQVELLWASGLRPFTYNSH